MDPLNQTQPAPGLTNPEPQTTSSRGVLVAIILVIILVVLGIIYILGSKPDFKDKPQAVAPSATETAPIPTAEVTLPAPTTAEEAAKLQADIDADLKDLDTELSNLGASLTEAVK